MAKKRCALPDHHEGQGLQDVAVMLLRRTRQWSQLLEQLQPLLPAQSTSIQEYSLFHRKNIIAPLRKQDHKATMKHDLKHEANKRSPTTSATQDTIRKTEMQ